MSDMVQQQLRRLNEKTLDQMYQESLDQPTGIVYEALAVMEGAEKRRSYLIVCLTVDSDMAHPTMQVMTEKRTDLFVCDWKETVIAKLLFESANRQAIVASYYHDLDGRLFAIALVASTPEEVKQLESMFTL